MKNKQVDIQAPVGMSQTSMPTTRAQCGCLVYIDATQHAGLPFFIPTAAKGLPRMPKAAFDRIVVALLKRKLVNVPTLKAGWTLSTEGNKLLGNPKVQREASNWFQ